MRYILFCFLLLTITIFGQEEERTKADSKPWILDQLLNQGLSAQKAGKHERAIKDLKLGLKIFSSNQLKYPKEYADFLEAHTVSSLALGKTNGLLKKYKEVLNIREKLNDPKKLSLIHLNISNYYQKKANYNLANKHAKKAYDYASELENNDIKFKTLETVFNLNTNKEINSYFKKYVDLKNELIEKKSEINKKADRYNYLSVEKDKEISLIKKDKLNLQKKIHHQENTTFKLWVLSFFILLLGLSVFIFQKNKIKKITLASDLKDRNSKELLAAFSKKLFNVRKNLTSFSRNVDEKELNQYSFYLRELEVIEKEIKEL